MNAQVRIKAVSRLQHFLTQHQQRTQRPVIDQTAPRSTYQPEYVTHRNVTMRTGGAK